jgi:hypothetical protein
MFTATPPQTLNPFFPPQQQIHQRLQSTQKINDLAEEEPEEEEEVILNAKTYELSSYKMLLKP